jgi:hypothetical protein
MKTETIKDLAAYLKKEGYLKTSLSIGSFGRIIYDGYGIEYTPSGYSFYYSERDVKKTLATFNSEKEVCDFAYHKIRKEDSLKQHCILFTKSLRRFDRYCAALNKRNINYKTDSILYKNEDDLRYRVFVFGKDLSKTRFMRFFL